MSTQTADNGRRRIVTAPEVPHHGVSLARAIPIWVGSAVINTTLLLVFFFVFSFLSRSQGGEPAPPDEPPAEVEDRQKDFDLTNTDLGLDSDLPLNYNNDRIEDVSVPGPVDPNAAVGIVNAPEGPRTNVPPPPGTGGGTGKGILDPNEAGGASMFGTPGGQGGPLGAPGGFGGRSGSTRVRMLQEGGGNARSEKAVADGLKWLALHQSQDGRWTLHDFHRHARQKPYPSGKTFVCNCRPDTTRRNDTAATAFGLLPFLGAGITHKAPRRSVQNDYSKTVNAALRYLMAKQDRNGYYGGDAYAHALATIAVCEAYGLTSDPVLKGSAQRAVNYVVAAQDPAGGGWRYTPRQAGDTSVTGWMLMALKSGQMAGLSVPKTAMNKCGRFLDSVESGSSNLKGGYGYMPNSGESTTMTAVGLLCRQYLGTSPRNPDLLSGVRKLRGIGPGKSGNLYYEYYATQVMHHMGGENWQFWNLGPAGNGKGGIRDTLIAKQDKGGAGREHQAGSWPVDAGSGPGGRMMATSLSLLALEVYYRHLPLYRRDAGVAKETKD